MTDPIPAGVQQEPVTEEEVLDLLFEALPDTITADLYGTRPNLPRPEFYLTIRGECWRVTAEPHPHPEPDPEDHDDD